MHNTADTEHRNITGSQYSLQSVKDISRVENNYVGKGFI